MGDDPTSEEKNIMKFANNEVLDVSIFDDNGALVANLDSLKKSQLVIQGGEGYLILQDALLDENLMKHINTYEENNTSDYEKLLGKQKYQTTIVFNDREDYQEYKIIGKGLLRNANTGADKEFIFEIPSATNDKHFDFEKDYADSNSSIFKYAFKMNPYNVEGDLVKMHI